MTQDYRAVLFDLDGTLTPVRSVWRHLHETLGEWESTARKHQDAFEAGAISYEEFCAMDAAHWKGMPESRVVLGHALRNALLPLVTVIGLNFGFMLAGSVLTETVFAWPGTGRLLYEAILAREPQER